MSFSLPFLNQVLSASTVATVLTLFGVFPRCVRESRLQSIFLLLIVLTVGEIAAWWFHDLWLILAVLLFPVLVVLIEGGSWAPWACICGACLLQNILVFLLTSASLAFHASGLLAGSIGWVAWVVQVVAALVTLAATFDVLNVLGRRHFPEKEQMEYAPEPVRWPGVCIQVPAYNEPPDLLAQTIPRLMQQDYPGPWMVQVIDNNTPDPATWLPIQALCQRLGDRVQFLHLDNWPGFKSGALNEGTRRLPAWVEVVAVVDADYLVDPHFLRATARHFVDPQVAFVQAPQHYREWRDAPYFEGLNYMYEVFFAISMVSRRELNSIACFGSMCLIRRSALEQIGGLDEESITEDMELSVRLLGRGWRGVYDHRCYGAGLMPFDFGALKKQRFRWAFGMIHVLKKHWRPMLGLPSAEGYSLTLKQRWCFLVLGLQYLAEVPPVLFALLQVVTILACFLGWPIAPPALSVALTGPLLLLVISGVRTVWALRETTRCAWSQAVGAFLFSLALSWITARACFSACIHKKGVFLRTPKTQSGQKWQRALRMTTQEILLSLSFVGVLVCVVRGHHLASLLPSLALLLTQACIYGQSVVCALAAEGIWLLPRRLFGTGDRRDDVQPEKKDQTLWAWLDAGQARLSASSAGAIGRGAIPSLPAPAWERSVRRRRQQLSPQKRHYYF